MKVVITQIPLKYFFYYHWLVLGFNELRKDGKIQFKIKPRSVIQRFFLWRYKIYLGLRKYFGFFKNNTKQDYLLKGYLETENKKKATFLL
jgi:hypothetical protein